MTRFARAKGSKASNERVPESATSWEVMKEDLKKAQNETKNKKQREEMNNMRQKSYDNFINETEKATEIKWAEFPIEKSLMKAKDKRKIKKNLVTENDVTDDMIDEFIKSGDVNDSQVENLKKEIELALKKEKISKPQKNKSLEKTNEETSQVKTKNKKRKKQNNDSVETKISINNDENKNDISNDDNNAPETATSKIPPKEIVVKKKKNKKQKLKIEPVTGNNKPVENKDVEDKQKTQNNVKSKKKQNQNNNVKNKNQNNYIKDKKQNQNNNAKHQQNQNNVKDKKQNQNNNAKDQQNQNNNVKNKKQNQNNNTTDKQQNQRENINLKRKIAKPRDDKEHKRRKPDLEDQMTITINGKKEELLRFEGYPVLKTDFHRLVELRTSLKTKGIPGSAIRRTMLLERRKAEKRLSRLKKLVCFNCRNSGHLLSDCPELNSNTGGHIDNVGTGICFKCGSTEHSANDCKGSNFKFAHCFICREQGHIARECPDNPRGLYPQGGACKICGDVTHLKKDCPQFSQEQQEKQIVVNTISADDRNIEGLSVEENTNKQSKDVKYTPKKIIKF